MKKLLKAFLLAEVLITLGIGGYTMVLIMNFILIQMVIKDQIKSGKDTFYVWVDYYGQVIPYGGAQYAEYQNTNNIFMDKRLSF